MSDNDSIRSRILVVAVEALTKITGPLSPQEPIVVTVSCAGSSFTVTSATVIEMKPPSVGPASFVPGRTQQRILDALRGQALRNTENFSVTLAASRNSGFTDSSRIKNGSASIALMHCPISKLLLKKLPPLT